MAPLRRRDFVLTVQNNGKTPKAPSSRNTSAITQGSSEQAPGQSDPASGVERMNLDGEASKDPEPEDPEATEHNAESTPIEYYDAKLWQVAVGIPSIVDYNLWRPQAAQFIRSESGIEDEEPGWVGKRPLGRGSFGMAGLWEKYDREGNVLDVSVLVGSWAETF